MDKSNQVFEELDFQKTESQPFNLKNLLFHYLRYWYLFVLSILLAYLGARIYLRYTIPQYEVKSTLLIKNQQDNDQFSQEFILRDLGIGGQESNVSDEIQILKSVTLMEEVVEELKLNIRLITKGRIRNNDIYANAPIEIDSINVDPEESGSFIIQILNNEEFTRIEKGNIITERFNVPFFCSLGYFNITRNNKDYNEGQPITHSG